MDANTLQFKGEKMKILIRLYLSDNDKPSKAIRLSDFEKALGYIEGRPDVRGVFKFLFTVGGLKEGLKKFGYRTYYIDRKIIKHIIDNQDIVKLVSEYFWYHIP